MSTIFPICFFEDTIEDVVERVKSERLEFLIVVDEDNKYKGIVEAKHLLWHSSNDLVNKDEAIGILANMVKSVSQDDDVFILQNIEDHSNVIPVVNSHLLI